MVTSFYKDLFNATDYLAPFCLTGAFPRIEAGRMEDMGSVPLDQEIHDVLPSMGALKLLDQMVSKQCSTRLNGMSWALWCVSWSEIALLIQTRLALLMRL